MWGGPWVVARRWAGLCGKRLGGERKKKWVELDR